jgi:hypothetical protein
LLTLFKCYTSVIGGVCCFRWGDSVTVGIEIDVRHDIERMTRSLTKLQQEVVPDAIARSMNRTVTHVKAHASSIISAETGLKVTLVKKFMLVPWKSTRTRLNVRLKATKREANLIEFVNARNKNTETFKQKLKGGAYKYAGVTAKAWRVNKTYKGTFIQHGTGSRKLVVIARRGAARYPLKNITGPSIAGTFARNYIKQSAITVGTIFFVRTFEHDLQYRLNKLH